MGEGKIEEMCEGPDRPCGAVKKLERRLPDVPTDYRQKPTPRQWRSIVRRLLRAVDTPEHVGRLHGDLTLSDVACRRLGDALLCAHRRKAATHVAGVPVRKMLRAVARRERWLDGAVAVFAREADSAVTIWRCGACHRHFQRWLGSLGAKGVERRVVVRAKIQLRYWGNRWKDVEPKLFRLLDDDDLILRAYAAYDIGSFYEAHKWERRDRKRNVPRPARTFARIRDIEVERPGIAGPFLWGMQRSMDAYDELLRESSEVDIRAWAFDIIANRHAHEPILPRFNGLDFIGPDELWAGDAYWVGRLRDIGRDDLAVSAATSTRVRRTVPELEPHLLALGYGPNGQPADNLSVGLVGYQLAAWHRIAHPAAVARGIVSTAEGAGFELFVIADVKDKPGRPRVAVLYAETLGQTLSAESSETLLDVLLDPSARGPELPAKDARYYRESHNCERREFANKVYVNLYRAGAEASDGFTHAEIIANGLVPDWEPIERLRSAGLLRAAQTNRPR